MQSRLVLGVTGEPGTGKSTLSDYLADTHDFLVLEGSILLKKYAGELGMKLTSRDSYDTFFRQQQRIRGMAWLSDITLSATHNRVLQAGLRSKYDFRQIKNGGGFIIGLTCPPAIALGRMDTTNPKNPQTVEEYRQHQLIEESKDEYGNHTMWCVEHADYQLDTSKPLTETYHELDDIVAELTN